MDYKKEYMSEEEAYRTIDTCLSNHEDIKKKLPDKLILGISMIPNQVKKDGYYTYKGIQIPVIIQEETYKEGLL